MDLALVQKQQEEFDKKFWSHQPGFETIRHSTLHIGKLMGKLSTYCEAVEHGEKSSSEQLDLEVIPDLLIFAARLANDRGIKLDSAFEKRKNELIRRFSA